MVHQPWKKIEFSLLELPGRETKHYLFQSNKAMFRCQNFGEAGGIAQLGSFFKGQPNISSRVVGKPFDECLEGSQLWRLDSSRGVASTSLVYGDFSFNG